MAAELVGGALLSAVLGPLVDKLTSVVVEFFKGKEALVKLVEELKKTLSSADLLLDDAEAKLITDHKVKKWLDDLKDTIYAADDLVYKIVTEASRKELEGGRESGSSRKRKALTYLIPSAAFTAFDKAIKPEIEEVLEKLKVILENKDPHLHRMERQKLPERVPAPLVEESDVYGRTDDKEAIIKLLLADDDGSGNKLSVIPIVGMGGIGKTTLAQLVLKDERIQKSFDTKEWVTVGTDKIDCLKVLKAIIEEVTSKKCETKEPYKLQKEAKEVLSKKKFLFVLDDIWDENPHKWELLKSSFESGLCGSKILLTTRSEVVASNVKTGPIHRLGRISDDDGWRLFAKHASIDANSVEHSNLQETGRKIVDKCEGLPLAIKSLGGLLRGKQKKDEWDSILNSDIWELYQRKSIDILPALWLSYLHLPSHLKSCFSYCALFPKDYKFVKKDIILLWMAEGLLHPKKNKRIEEVGEEYFEDLTAMSFFQLTSEDESTLSMHDLMHDLAIFVNGDFSLDMHDTKFPDRVSKIRHLSYKEADDPLEFEKFESLSKAKGLRTFLTIRKPDWDTEWPISVEHLLESLLSTKSCVRVLSLDECTLYKWPSSIGDSRVLSLSKCAIYKLPSSIGDLKYLKYLNLSISTEEIPDTICNLYNLQTLLLEGCDFLVRLPKNIGNLINLRHLSIPADLEEMPVQIGKMKNLQSLNRVIVGKNRESGIKLLKELQDLHGSLEIYYGPEGVADVNDALEAGLENKKFLSELKLDFGDSDAPVDLEKEREVLDALKPHTKLKKLSIRNYKGNNFPDWVGNHLYCNLVYVRLIGCKKCCSLPPLGQLSSLKQLFIEECNGVERISREFYYSSAAAAAETMPFRSLETLKFQKMWSLREWSFMEGEVEGRIFPRLKQLELRICPKLRVSLPDYLTSLRELRIKVCEQLLPLVPNNRAQQMDTAFPSLEILEIDDCDRQDSVLEGGLPSSLKQITISGCKRLKALDEETFQRLTSLESLEISRCLFFERLPRRLPTSLSELRIDGFSLIKRVERETGEDWPILRWNADHTTIDDDSVFNFNGSQSRMDSFQIFK